MVQAVDSQLMSRFNGTPRAEAGCNRLRPVGLRQYIGHAHTWTGTVSAGHLIIDPVTDACI